MKITASQLVAVFPQSKSVAQQYADMFNELFPKYGITTRERVAGFISQVGHESMGFTRLVENLNYSAHGLAATWKSRYSTGKMVMVKGRKVPEPNMLALSLHRRPEAIANNCYADRMGNGPEASGDGWKFRGRGLLMITGKFNYTRVAKATGLDLLKNPELLEQPRNATVASLIHWDTEHLNVHCDKRDLVALSKGVNGGLIGFDERKELFERAMEVFA